MSSSKVLSNLLNAPKPCFSKIQAHDGLSQDGFAGKQTLRCSCKRVIYWGMMAESAPGGQWEAEQRMGAGSTKHSQQRHQEVSGEVWSWHSPQRCPTLRQEGQILLPYITSSHCIGVTLMMLHSQAKGISRRATQLNRFSHQRSQQGGKKTASVLMGSQAVLLPAVTGLACFQSPGRTPSPSKRSAPCSCERRPEICSC